MLEGMSHPVQQKVDSVSRRAWRLRAAYGIGIFLVCAVATTFALGLADYCLRFEDPGIRYLSTAVVCAVLLVTLWRFVVPALAYRPSDLEIAQRIEHHFPELKNCLSSSIAFIAQSEYDQDAGSADLRRAVVARMAAEIEDHNFDRCLDSRRARRIVGLSIVVCLLVAVVCALNWPSAALATCRLAMPWKTQPWPRRNQLQFVDPPTRIATGSDFEAELVDRNGRLPQSAQIHYWYEGEEERDQQQKEMKYFGDRMVHRLENVTRPFQYRAVGGDDDTMPWISLEVVEPPQIESVTIQLHPPTYTGWAVKESGENIHALEGTVIELAGWLNKPAAAVSLKMEGADSQQTPAVEMVRDGMGFRIASSAEPPWRVNQSGTYWFEVTDADGLSGGGEIQWSIRAVEDAEPSVSLEKPASNTFVTPDALVILKGTVKDDLAIHTIIVSYLRSDASESDQPQTMEILRQPETPPIEVGVAGVGDENDDVQAVDFVWDLSKLPDLEPGLWIDFELIAEDYKPQMGHSTSRRLTIISASELEERVAARRSFVLGQLAEVLRVQREVRMQTSSLEIGLQEQGRLSREDIDRLQAAELRQRQVSELLVDPADGVETQIISLLGELQSNRINSPEVLQRMNELLDAVRQIGSEPLPEIQRELINALKAAREDLPKDEEPDSDSRSDPDPSTAHSLTAAGQRQDEVISALETLLGDFTQWDSYRRFSRELSRLRQLQEEIRQDTDRMRLDNLAKTLDELTPEQRANLRRLAERQTELSRQFVRIQTRMEQMRSGLVDSDPAAAETLADALDLAARTAIGGQMRDSGRRIEDNQLGQATDSQASVLRNLQDLVDTLVNRREHELGRRADKLKGAEGELAELRKKQKELRKKFQEADDVDDPDQRRLELERLQAQQQTQAEQAKRLARRLERLTAEQSAQSLTRAASEQEQAAESAKQGQAGSALEHAQDAERLLEQAEEQLREERRRAEQDLLQEQMTKLEQEIGGLARRQQSVLDSTTSFEQLRLEQEGRWTRAQSVSVGNLARQHRALATETGSLAEKAAAAEAFVLGIRGAMREMDRAARGLDRRQADEPTQRAERNALLRLQQLQQALEQDDASGDDGQGQGDSGGQQPPGDAIQRLAELKLLKLMQQEINRQTTELEQQRLQNGELTDGQLQLLRELSDEQGRLAELILKFGESSPDEAPEGMLDIEEDGDIDLDRASER